MIPRPFSDGPSDNRRQALPAIILGVAILISAGLALPTDARASQPFPSSGDGTTIAATSDPNAVDAALGASTHSDADVDAMKEQVNRLFQEKALRGTAPDPNALQGQAPAPPIPLADSASLRAAQDQQSAVNASVAKYFYEGNRIKPPPPPPVPQPTQLVDKPSLNAVIPPPPLAEMEPEAAAEASQPANVRPVPQMVPVPPAPATAAPQPSSQLTAAPASSFAQPSAAAIANQAPPPPGETLQVPPNAAASPGQQPTAAPTIAASSAIAGSTAAASAGIAGNTASDTAAAAGNQAVFDTSAKNAAAFPYIPTAQSVAGSGYLTNAPNPATAQAQSEIKNELVNPATGPVSDLTSKNLGDTQKTLPDTTSIEDAEFLKGLVGSNGVILLNVAGTGARPDFAQPVMLDEAVAFALKNNFEVLAAGEKSSSSYYDKLGAYSEYGPSIEAYYSTGSERSEPASYNDASGNRVLDSTHHRYDKSITVRQPLIDLAVVADILSGHDREDISKADERDTRESIANDTVNAFLKVVQARVAVRLADQYKAYLDDLATRMQVRVEGGGGTKADLERIHERATLAEAARVEAMGDYETNTAEFTRLTKITPAQLQLPTTMAPSIPETPQAALEIAARTNPSYISSLSKIDAAADDRNKSIATLLPKLALQYNYSFSYDPGGSAQGSPLDGIYPTQTNQSVMLVAQWALNGGTAIAGGFSNEAHARELSYRSRDVQARIEQGIRSGYTAVNAARERQGILRKTVESNTRIVKAFEEQYKDGNRSLFELLDAYEQLYSSRLNLMRVVVAKAQAFYLIRRQMGQLVPSVIETTRK